MTVQDGIVAPRARDLIQALPDSKIRQISALGMDNPDVIPLWFGESDEITPEFVREAAKQAIDAGHTFYTGNNGIPPLREEIRQYMSRVYEKPFETNRISVTASGMSAIVLTMQALVSPGDNVLVVEPVWPNCRETVSIMGGEPRRVALDEVDGVWSLDLDRMFSLADDRTTAIFINSPGNPSGWVMPEEQIRAVLDWARPRGIWVICDDVYARLVYDADRAPSFIALAEPDDRVIAVNSFSKTWSMTGWRLGWLTHPPALEHEFAKLNEFNIAAPTSFVQHAGIVALRDGEDYVADMRNRLRMRRDLVTRALGQFDRVRYQAPDAAFYAFFALDGMTDSVEFCKRALTEANVGLAPGLAFGPQGEGYIRLCFASSEKSLSAAMDRLAPLLR